jgi:NSS family neurotransmitter:Na+ symporter
MGPAGPIFGAIFFISLVVAGLSSAISIVEAFTSAVVDKFGTDRKILATLLSIAGFLGGIIFTTQGGLYWLDIVDHFINAYGLVVVGLLECIVVGWFFRLETIRKHLNKVSSFGLGLWWNWMIKFLLPGVLIVIMINQLTEEVTKPYGGYTWASLISIGWNWVGITFLLSFILAVQPWRTRANLEKGRSDKKEE